jgi:hypothetical protein
MDTFLMECLFYALLDMWLLCGFKESNKFCHYGCTTILHYLTKDSSEGNPEFCGGFLIGIGSLPVEWIPYPSPEQESVTDF